MDLAERFPRHTRLIVGVVFAFLCRHIREMLDAGLADSARHTAVFWGTLILIRVLLSAIYPFFIWGLNSDSLDYFYEWLGDLLYHR